MFFKNHFFVAVAGIACITSSSFANPITYPERTTFNDDDIMYLGDPIFDAKPSDTATTAAYHDEGLVVLGNAPAPSSVIAAAITTAAASSSMANTAAPVGDEAYWKARAGLKITPRHIPRSAPRAAAAETGSDFLNPYGVVPDGYTLPLVAGNASIPAISQNMTLQYVNFIVGTWNYTCANASATPQEIGGVGILFNATDLAYAHPEETFHTFAAQLIEMSLPDIANQVPLLKAYGDFYQLELHLGITVIGSDYFAATLAGLAPAPVGAPAGPDGSEALAWAKFTSVAGYNKGAITEGYRIHTAGGNVVGDCSNRPASFTVPFASESWMFGP